MFVGTGPDVQRFHCFRPLLIRLGSTYFQNELAQAAYRPRDPPYDIPAVRLPDEKPADFSLFKQWMDNERDFHRIDEVRERTPFELARLFCFGDRMGVLKLRNACIDCLYRKAVDLISSLTGERKKDSRKSLKDCVGPWKRAIRWVLSDASICTDSSCLLRFFTDFFAFFVLQYVRLLEENLLSDLPAVFLEHVDDAVRTALARNAPGVPALSPHPPTTIDVPATTTTTAIMEQIDGKTITVIRIDDDGDDGTATEAAPAPPGEHSIYRPTPTIAPSSLQRGASAAPSNTLATHASTRNHADQLDRQGRSTSRFTALSIHHGCLWNYHQYSSI